MLCKPDQGGGFMGNRIFMNTFSAMSSTILRLFSAATLKGISALQCSISVDWVNLWLVILHFINKNGVDITLLSLLTSQAVMNFLFDEKLWGSLFLPDIFIMQLCVWLSWPDMFSCFHVYLPPQPLCVCVGCLNSPHITTTNVTGAKQIMSLKLRESWVWPRFQFWESGSKANFLITMKGATKWVVIFCAWSVYNFNNMDRQRCAMMINIQWYSEQLHHPKYAAFLQTQLCIGMLIVKRDYFKSCQHLHLWCGHYRNKLCNMPHFILIPQLLEFTRVFPISVRR